MLLLAASALAILVGLGIFGLLAARLWMKLVWRMVMLGLGAGALGAVVLVAWVWTQR